MLLLKEWTFLVLLAVNIIGTFGYRVDTKKQPSIQASSSNDEYVADDSIKVQESFNPGHPQHGGWHKPENLVHLESSYSDNQWSATGLDTQDDSGQGGGYAQQQGSIKVGQTVNFPSASGSPESSQYSGFAGGSLNRGGDLVVGQGSVQRPANLNQYHSGAVSQGVGSFPVQAHIAPGTSQFSQVISSGSKKPQSFGDHSEHSAQQSNAASSHRPVSQKAGQVQHQQSHPAFSAQGHSVQQVHPVFPQPNHGKIKTGIQYQPQPSLGPHQPSLLGPKLGYKPKIVPNHQVPQGGPRYPGQGPSHFGVNSNPRLGGKIQGVKYLSQPPQPVYHFQKSPSAASQKYFNR